MYYASAKISANLCGEKIRKQQGSCKKLPWPECIQLQVQVLMSDIECLKQLKVDKIIKSAKVRKFKKKYMKTTLDIDTSIETIKQVVCANVAQIARQGMRIRFFKDNDMFKNNLKF